MKKATSVIGMFSFIAILLCAAIPAIAKTPHKDVLTSETTSLQQAGSPTGSWDLVFNAGQQKLYVQQAAGNALSGSISIANSKGNVIYNGQLSGSKQNIDFSDMQAGKYIVSVQNGAVVEQYVLIIQIF